MFMSSCANRLERMNSNVLRMSQLFLRTLREDPADADVTSAKLMQRAGYIRKSAPGVWTWLPLGLKVLNKVQAIIRDEINGIGAQEVHFPALLPREPYGLPTVGKNMATISSVLRIATKLTIFLLQRTKKFSRSSLRICILRTRIYQLLCIRFKRSIATSSVRALVLFAVASLLCRMLIRSRLTKMV